MVATPAFDSESDAESDGAMPVLVPVEAPTEEECSVSRRETAPPEAGGVRQGATRVLWRRNGQLPCQHDEEEEEMEGVPGGRSVSMLPPCTDEQCEEEYGYPKWPEEMMDPDYFREEFYKMRTDPRHNKNLGRSMQHPDFWNEATRKPWAKVLLRKEQYWTERRSVWIEQYDRVIKANRTREGMMELLEDSPTELKRLLQPMLRYKIVEHILLNILEESRDSGVPLDVLLQREETLLELRSVRRRLDDGGETEAQRMIQELDIRAGREQQALAERRRQEEKQRGRTLIDMAGLKIALDFGQKCKKDGLLEWRQGNWEEALASWRQGDDTLRRFRAPARSVEENLMIVELHSAVLRNLSQAAIKLELWNEALDAAERALEMDEDDHKAWFRKACALEGLSKFKQAMDCLRRIEELAVGRLDRDRIVRDCEKKRERFRVVQERHHVEQQRMLTLGVRRGVFSNGRLGITPTLDSQEQLENEVEEPTSQLDCGGAAQAAPSKERKRLTRDGASDLLDDLEAAYQEPWLLKRVDKLIRDVCFDTKAFIRNLGTVALEAQGPVLAKWGFDVSREGVAEMRAAVRDHTQGPRGDLALREKAAKVNKVLYGSPELRMHERIMGGVEQP